MIMSQDASVAPSKKQKIQRQTAMVVCLWILLHQAKQLLYIFIRMIDAEFSVGISFQNFKFGVGQAIGKQLG